MPPLTKVYNAKIKRRSSQECPPLSDRSGLSILEIPPRLCHLTGDALAEPFPPIAVGGYIKYYRRYSGPGGRRETMQSISPSRNAESDPLANKTKRRASSASILVKPSLSHNPKPSPSKEIPPHSVLFGTTRIQVSSPISSSSPIAVPQSPRQRYHLSIIPEASRETMRVDLDADAMFTSKSRKPRVVSLPPSFPTLSQSSSLTSSGFNDTITSDPPSPSITSNSVNSANSATTSRTSALRRTNRRLLRTPSVEYDFAPYAKEIMNIPKSDTDNARQLSRQYSSGSDVTDEEGTMSATESVNTAVTSLLEPSLPSSTPPSSPSSPGFSPTKCPTSEFPNANKNVLPTPVDSSPKPAVDCPQIPPIFDLFHSNGSESLDDWSLQTFLELVSKNTSSEKRESWSSFMTAKSFSDLLPTDEAPDNSPKDKLKDDQLVAVGIAL